ncbi:MAG TPA: hypothetical protein VHU44_02365 [Acidobacteriaceae bacterium]|jgi:opacity protein-like surface antigen|nr:hypothetical protein [Acidobacteriaceae bacterium]
MKRTTLAAIAVIAWIISAQPSKAQVGIYGQFNTTHDGAVSAWYNGFSAGVYDDMLGAGPIHAGLDLRGSFQSGSQYRYRSFLVGPRVQVRPPVLPFNPYIQGMIGLGGSRYTGASSLPTHYSNKFQYGVIGGLEYTVLPRIDLRLPEIGYLKMSAVSSIPNAPAVDLVSLGFGVVVRLP